MNDYKDFDETLGATIPVPESACDERVNASLEALGKLEVQQIDARKARIKAAGIVNLRAGKNKALYKKEAKKAGYTLSTWVRQVLDAAARVQPIADYDQLPYCKPSALDAVLENLRADLVRASCLYNFLEKRIGIATRREGDADVLPMPFDLKSALDTFSEDCKRLSVLPVLIDIAKEPLPHFSPEQTKELDAVRLNFVQLENYMRTVLLAIVRREKNLSSSSAKKLMEQAIACAEELNKIEGLLQCIIF